MDPKSDTFHGLNKEPQTSTLNHLAENSSQTTNQMAKAQAAIPDDFELPIQAFDIPRCYDGDLSAVVIPEGLVKDRVRRLAKDIHAVIGNEQLSLLCVLKGSYKFFTGLVDELSNARWDCPEPMTVDFIRTKSYEDTESSGTLKIIGLSNLEELRGKNVLIVEDIVDSGLTLSRLIHTLTEYGVKKTWTALLLSKRVPRKIEVTEDFVAFTIPDKFIVGYGLDYNQKFRDLNHICVMSPSGIEKYKNKMVFYKHAPHCFPYHLKTEEVRVTLLMLFFILATSTVLVVASSTSCMLCDTFQGYCDLEGSTCVGSLCASRIATLEQGLIRVQKLCVPTDTPLGCRSTILWKGLQGRECVCEGHMCNAATSHMLAVTLGLLTILLNVSYT